MPISLSKDDAVRYRRQLIMPEIGAAGQARIKTATVIVAGLGGLGGLSAWYMAAAGVGRLKLVDNDRVALHNLNRQILYATGDIGKRKAMCARDRLHALNPSCRIEAIDNAIGPDTVDEMASGCDLIIDGGDNFEMRAVLNQAALNLGIPFIFGGVNGFSGMVAAFSPGKGACLRCVFPKAPSSMPAEIGIIGPTAGVIASLQAMEAIKRLIGRGSGPSARMIHFDGLEARFKKMVIERDPQCPACA